MDIKKFYMPQKMMTKVLYSLIPLYALAIFFYGWRVLLVFLAVAIAGALAEYAIGYLIQKDKFKVTEACFVTAALYTLTLPPAVPIYIAIIGMVFAIVFGKMAFGGFGRNIFNPALVGRCFIYIAFPNAMTMRWTQPFLSLPSGLLAFTRGEDAITQATPLLSGQARESWSEIWPLLWGGTSGSMGETSIILICLAAIYLVVTKTASLRIMLSVLLSASAFTFFFSLVSESVPPTVPSLLAGGLFFMAIFMATDPVTAPKDKTAQTIVGVLIGFVTVVIRNFSLFPEGAMFAVLVGNSFAPLIERHVKSIKQARKAKADGVVKKEA